MQDLLLKISTETILAVSASAVTDYWTVRNTITHLTFVKLCKFLVQELVNF